MVLASTGVNLFFVLSGFLITGILINNKLTDEKNGNGHAYSIKQFFIRRTIRIFPIYYVLIFTTFVIDLKPCREIFFWLVTYTSNIYWSRGGTLGVFGHLWSLAVEEQFYLLFPFFILFIPKRYTLHSLYGLILFAIATRFIAFVMHPDGVESYVLMPCCLDSFATGGLLSYWSIFNKEKLVNLLNKKWIFILSLSLFLVFCIRLHLNPNGDFYISMFYRFFISIVCFWLIGTATLREFTGGMQLFLENKIVVYLGKISYGLYVYHHFMPYLFASIIEKTNISLPWPTLHIFEYPIIYFLLTLLFSVFSWHVLERPINSLKKHFEYKPNLIKYD